MQTTDWIQAISTVVLAIITGAYAWQTWILAKVSKKQAEASVEMAQEMRQQKYESVRPVLDILRVADSNTKTVEAYTAKDADYSRGLSCSIENVGFGTALDVYSIIVNPDFMGKEEAGKRRRFDHGNLPVSKRSDKMPLAIEQDDGRKAIVVYCRDAYGRTFEYSRAVSADKVKGWILGPLAFKLIEEQLR